MRTSSRSPTAEAPPAAGCSVVEELLLLVGAARAPRPRALRKTPRNRRKKASPRQPGGEKALGGARASRACESSPESARGVRPAAAPHGGGEARSPLWRVPAELPSSSSMLGISLLLLVATRSELTPKGFPCYHCSSSDPPIAMPILGFLP